MNDTTSDKNSTTFLTGNNRAYLETLIENGQWPGDNNDLKTIEENHHLFLKSRHRAKWLNKVKKTYTDSPDYNAQRFADFERHTPSEQHHPSSDPSLDDIKRSLRALMYIRAHRVRGHLHADLDPLSLNKKTERPMHGELDPTLYDLDPEDNYHKIFLDGVLGFDYATPMQICKRVNEVYCRNIGIEYMHIQDPDIKQWIQEKFENTKIQTSISNQQRQQYLSDLIRADEFERFLDKKFVGAKRFGLEGGESLIVALEEILRSAAQDADANEFIFGMAHRGRLNTLANVIGKPIEAILSEFQAKTLDEGDMHGSGDVKYHLGTSNTRNIHGKDIYLSLMANPSHLEAVNPVVLGKARAKQALKSDHNRSQVIPLLIHGDAAFAGQGIVAETLTLSELKGYEVGGTIHIIINNQIGFTTAPQFSRSSQYCSDIAKGIQAPIFHVNGDCPEDVAFVSQIAMEYRQKYKRDIVIDLVCYRRHGHNEIDDPSFTQPKMYAKIKKHPSTMVQYGQLLTEHGVIKEGVFDDLVAKQRALLEDKLEKAKSYKPSKLDWLEGHWRGLRHHIPKNQCQSGVDKNLLRKIGLALNTVPDTFGMHKLRKKQVTQLYSIYDQNKKAIDWAMAESLAFGSLLLDGHPVRLSGQDSGRGTFSQRHSVWTDQSSSEKYIPLNHLSTEISIAQDAFYEVIDSPLSEYGVLGYEYGYSTANPHQLVLWEAQFGDFANGAQIIFDQFIASAESKWLRMSGLVMMLPHGYEGQGPEHSSARLERFLQLCAEDNMQIAYCSTPANYFHILRRQLCRDIRKPLVLMTPKYLLRHKKCISRLADMDQGTSFQPVLVDDLGGKKSKVKSVIFTSGKIYYDLMDHLEKEGLKPSMRIIRLEQIYPLPAQEIINALKDLSPNTACYLLQEEPRNMGSWSFLLEHLGGLLQEAGFSKPLGFIGRKAASSPATGFAAWHIKEQNELLEKTVKTAL